MFFNKSYFSIYLTSVRFLRTTLNSPHEKVIFKNFYRLLKLSFIKQNIRFLVTSLEPIWLDTLEFAI